MAKTVVRIDGQRVASGTAAAFKNMAKAFKKRWGLTLHIRSGLRTWQQQYNLWYKYKYQGGTYALHPSAAQAYHYEGNAHGGRSIDVYDSGSDAGVTVAGSVRANWLKANASKWGFWARGYTFSSREPWHYEYQGNVWAGGSPSGGSTSKQKGFFGMARKSAGRSKSLKLKKGDTIIPLENRVNSPTSILVGKKAHTDWAAFTSFSFSNLPEGKEVQVKYIYTDGNTRKITHGKPTKEIIGTGGKSFDLMGYGGSLPKGARLRVLVRTFEPDIVMNRTSFQAFHN